MVSSLASQVVEVSTIEFLNSTIVPSLQAWCGTALTWIFLSIVLPLFILALGAYIIFTVDAWRSREGIRKTSQAPPVPVQCRFTKLPFLGKMEAVLTWNWISG
ncbi:uncharacterized protein LAJ45_00010 [Morchella importuna]|uniref:uncharacterized protein n=1 Tax=Morchella importuna TaxID=1174673 RepID=UPI001E8DA41E|nr:uncharacterized protein LAJ45_00010 [Morchella importuna]KAH8155002.1 hypothetical protein LAJ45_00010 [Morchella importuna]